MEDRFGEGMYLIATIFAFIALTIANTVVAWIDDATLEAGWHITVCLLEEVVQTTGVVGEAFVELLDGELHTYSVLQRLHVVKG